MRVVCLIAYVAPSRSGRSLNQHTIASTSWVTIGMLFGRQSMSPRLTSRSSARRMLTDIGGNASATGPPYSSMPAIVVVKPVGSTTTSSPGRNMPLATLPA